MIRAAATVLALMPAAASAQIAPAPAPAVGDDPALAQRIGTLSAMLGGRGDYARYFAPVFQRSVSPAQFRMVTDQLRITLGAPVRIETITPTGRWSADILVAFERGTAMVKLLVTPAAPHAVSGLLVSSVAPRGDTLAALAADIRALPGKAGLGIYALGDAAPVPVVEVRGRDAAPLGSAFKLWVLGETARQVAAGTRRWADVVPAGAPSLSGTLGTWPAGSPVTVQTLATLMISVSDNTATDTLMTALGRARIDAAARAAGGTAPVPTTRELIAIKSDPTLIAAWTAATPAGRTALLADNAARFAAAPLDPAVFSGLPVAIDSVEWFASPAAMAATLDELRTGGDATTLDVLRVNPGVDAGTAARFAYVGFKGGSEPGVATLNYLVRTKGGAWYAITANWHRSDATVDEARLVGLMTRALTLVAAR